ncbi:MAG TPA: YciI family protein [Chitinophagales bacterium]|nr:YciI family protein [Chitinophagales bacterium]
MKYIFYFLFLFFAISVSAKPKKTVQTDTVKRIMKQYYFVMLTKGNNRTQDSVTAAQIQKAHLENIGRLANAGKIIVAGPFGDDGNWRGIFIFDAASKEEVEQLLQTDPAVSAGRLAYEIHPWWTQTGTIFK